MKENISEKPDDSFSRVFTLTEAGFENIKEKIRKLKKRGSAVVELEVLGSTYKPFGNFGMVKMIDFRFSEKYFQLGKWDVIGIKELDGNVIVVHSIGEENRKFPEFVWSKDFTCAKCKTSRERVRLFIIQNKATGDVLQMGSKCLSDFVGMNLSQMTNFLEYKEEVESMIDYEAKLVKDFDKDDMDPKSSRRAVGAGKRFIHIDTLKFLALCYRFSKDGYVSYNDAYCEGIPSTKDLAVRQYFELLDDSNEHDPKDEISEEELDIARKSVEYYLSLKNEEDKEFVRNVQNILREEYLSLKFASYVAFLPSTYLKHLEYEKEKARKIEFKSGKVGEIGEKIETEVRVYQVNSFEQNVPYAYEPITMLFVIFVDQDNHKLVWKSNSKTAFSLKLDDKFILRATVKKHEKYRGIEETHVTRCKLTKI